MLFDYCNLDLLYCYYDFVYFFFFKQKTAYEMRVSDWSSDVCSSDLTSVVHYDDSDSKAYNIIAEIPGSDPKAGYVMAGAHLDSWVAGDGAADNGAGTAMIMEAARILADMGVRPKRTIRCATSAGEATGLCGCLASVYQTQAPAGSPHCPTKNR